MGGLARKAHSIDATRRECANQGRGLLVVDAGDLLFPEEPLIEDEIAQRRVKAEMILEANAGIGLDAVGVGALDLRLGVEYLKEAAASSKLPFLSANLVDAKGVPVFAPHRIETLCRTKVGIFSVLTSMDPAGNPLLPGPNYRVEDPFETARKEVAALHKEGAEVIFALTNLGLQDDLRLAREVPGIAFIFGGHSRTQLSEPQKVETRTGDGDDARTHTTWIFQTGYRGKQLGRVDVDLVGPAPEAFARLADVSNLDRVKNRISTYEERIEELGLRLETESDADRKLMLEDQATFYREQLVIERKALPESSGGSSLRNQIIQLSREVPDHPKTAKLVDAGLEKIAALPPPAPIGHEDGDKPAPGPKEGPYVGAQVCQACHQDQYKDWKATPHAHAYQTLVRENHKMDFDCVGCHTTGYRKEGGPKDPFTVAGLTDVQCESCHGPGRPHATDPKKVDMTTAFTEASCRTCHSTEQTGDRFDFPEYLKKVDHGKSARLSETPAKK